MRMSDNIEIKGRGGKSGSGGNGDKNTLRAIASLRVIGLISEGAVEGFTETDVAKQIFANNVPLKDSDGNANFEGISYAYRYGLPDQEVIPGFYAGSSIVSLGDTNIRQGTPYQFTVNSYADAIILTVALPSLYDVTNAKKGMRKTSVSYSVSVKPATGSFNDVLTKTYTNQKCVSRYEEDLYIPLPKGGAPWTVKITRHTPDAAPDVEEQLQNQTLAARYQPVIEGKFNYPNRAILAVEIDAEQFGSSQPSFKVQMKGVKVWVPKNYDPLTRVYATSGAGTTNGIWDGSFKQAWTDNPAWILLDLLTNNRYGLGSDFWPITSPTQLLNGPVDARVNKWSLYEISQYCDALVPDGYGGTEPRYTINVQISNRDDAFNVLTGIVSVFRGMMYYANGELLFTSDKDESPSFVFTQTDVIDGLFNYSSGAIKTLNSVCSVKWQDPNNYGGDTVEIYEDPELLATYGYRMVELEAFGCYSRSLARRMAKWKVLTEKLQNETLTFSVGEIGGAVFPGAIIDIYDPYKSGVRAGGKIVSSSLSGSNTLVVVDQVHSATLGTSPTFNYVGNDGTPKTVTLLAANTTTNTYTISGSVSDIMENSYFAVSWASLTPQKYRVISVTESDEDNAETYDILALKHSPSKYAQVESDIVFEEPQTSIVSRETPPAPATLIVNPWYTSNLGSESSARVTVTWSEVAGFPLAKYELQLETSTEPYSTVYVGNDISWSSEVIPTTTTTEFRARVRLLDATGRTSEWKYSDVFAVLGNTEPPTTTSNMNSDNAGMITEIFWDNPDIPDYRYTEVWSNTIDNTVTAQLEATVATDSYTYTHTDLADRYFWTRVVTNSLTNNTSVFSNSVLTTPNPNYSVNAYLTQSVVVIPTDSAGNNAVYTNANTTIKVMENGVDVSALWSVSPTTSNITGSLSGKTYTVTNISANTGYVDFLCTRAGYTNILLRFSLSKLRAGATGSTGPTGATGPAGANGVNGADGSNNTIVYLYAANNSTTVAPTKPTTGTSTYTFATNTITGQPSGWSISRPTADMANAYMWVITATASSTTATDSIANTEWSTPVLIGDNGLATANGVTLLNTTINGTFAATQTEKPTSKTWTIQDQATSANAADLPQAYIDSGYQWAGVAYGTKAMLPLRSSVYEFDAIAEILAGIGSVGIGMNTFLDNETTSGASNWVAGSDGVATRGAGTYRIVCRFSYYSVPGTWSFNGNILTYSGILAWANPDSAAKGRPYIRLADGNAAFKHRPISLKITDVTDVVAVENRLANILSDGIITAGQEKVDIIAFKDRIVGEYTRVSGQAASFEVPYAAYTSAYNNWLNYFNSLPNISNTSVDTAVNRTTYNSYLLAYSNAKTDLENSIQATQANLMRVNTNLCQNPSGALGLRGWTGNGNWYVQTESGWGDVPYFAIHQGSNTTGSVWLQNTIPCVPGLVLSTQAKIINAGLSPTAKFNMYIQWINASGTWFASTPLVNTGMVGSDGWILLKLENQIAPNNTAYARLTLHVDGDGTWSNTFVAFREVKLERGSICTIYTADSSLNLQSRINDIISDGIITAGQEKADALAFRDRIVGEYGRKTAQATSFGLTYAAYTASYNNWLNYFNSLSNISDSNVDTTINRTTYNNYLWSYTNDLNDLENAIAWKASTLATWAGVTGTGRPEDNADVTLNAQISIDGLAATTFDFSGGSVTSGQLPRNIQARAFRGGTEVTTGGVWSITNMVNCTVSVNASTGVESITALEGGGQIERSYVRQFTYNGKLSGQQKVTINYNNTDTAAITSKAGVPRTFGNIIDRNIWVTIATNGVMSISDCPANSVVTISGSFGCENPVGNCSINLRLKIDGVVVYTGFAQEVSSGGVTVSADWSELFNYKHTALLSAGTHTFSVEAQRTSGTGSVSANGNLFVTVTKT